MLDSTHEWNRSLKPLIWGLIFSAVILVATYFVANSAAVIVFGCAQALIQLYLFMNIGAEAKPRYSLLLFIFLVFVMLILVLGTIWIMYNLNYNVMNMDV